MCKLMCLYIHGCVLIIKYMGKVMSFRRISQMSIMLESTSMERMASYEVMPRKHANRSTSADAWNLLDTKDQTSNRKAFVYFRKSEMHSTFLNIVLMKSWNVNTRFSFLPLSLCWYLFLALFHLTAADGPGDRFIIGESQAGEQVRFRSLKDTADVYFTDFEHSILSIQYQHCGNLKEVWVRRLSKG